MTSFAIIPAAGIGRRFGGDKLLMPGRKTTILEDVAAAWEAGGVDRILIVVRGDDTALMAAAERTGAETVLADPPPPDMKASVRAAIRRIDERFPFAAEDVFLIAPGDMPLLSASIIRRLIQAAETTSADILVPTIAGRRGHPTLFRRSLSSEIDKLPENVGLNILLRRHAVGEIPCADLAAAEQAFADIDTPEDYRRLFPRRGET